MIVLVGAGAAIFFSTQYSLENVSMIIILCVSSLPAACIHMKMDAHIHTHTQQSSDGLSLEGLVSPVVITTLNLVLPFFFGFLARFEKFKTQSGEIKMTLVRLGMLVCMHVVYLALNNGYE